jgi:hypothetical protein
VPWRDPQPAIGTGVPPLVKLGHIVMAARVGHPGESPSHSGARQCCAQSFLKC